MGFVVLLLDYTSKQDWQIDPTFFFLSDVVIFCALLSVNIVLILLINQDKLHVKKNIF